MDTDEDVENFRSPSPSARSVRKRAQGSPFVSSQPSSRKRLSDSSDHSDKSPKFAKTANGKAVSRSHIPVSVQPPSLFKKPSLDMARSFQAGVSMASSTNTSFSNTTTLSQGTTTTANTSFSSNYGPNDFSVLKRAKSASTNTHAMEGTCLFGHTSFSDQEMFRADKRKPLERTTANDSSQEHRSTFGSVNEDDLLDATTQVEIEVGLASVPTISDSKDMKLASSTRNRNEHRPTHKSGSLGKLQVDGCDETTSFLSSKVQVPEVCQSKSIILNRNHFKTAPSSNGPPKDTAREDSPSKVSHHIRNIPEQNLFVDLPEQSLHNTPYFILFICRRVATSISISLEDLIASIATSSTWSSADEFWLSIRNRPTMKAVPQSPQEPNRVWQAAKRGFEGYTFKGRISFTSKVNGPVFALQLQPIQADKSCRFQRKFGSDRLLYLTAPTLENYTKRFNAAEMKQIRLRWNEWLMREHSFLGRKWRVFHIEFLKRGKANRKEITHDKRIVLFATEGWGIDKPCPVGSMLNWFLPFNLNEEQTVCKGFARFDLGLSRTVPTLVFKPLQVRPVPDKRANGEKEATTFNDSTLHWDRIPKQQIMNDGCSEMSVGAAREIWRLYKEYMGLENRLPLPSAFQGRIGGAKGLWMISGNTYSRDPADTDIWIQISDSQSKFSPHKDDLDDAAFDPIRLTFEVSNYSSDPSPSELHISFIPIMIDRGVSQQTIADFMTECLDADRSQLLDVMTDPVKTHEWIYRNGSKSCTRNEISWQAEMPIRREEKINLLLEAGFAPTKFKYLAECLRQFVTLQQISKEISLRTPLGKSTYLFGVADPIGVLKPGEIHVQFSTSFIDKMTGHHYRHLNNMEVLVARQPACRRSDVQKAHAIVRPELDHLVDVVVFPSRGEYPLAGKLQGGDYDGDIFWLCWETKLVTPFKNAPAPVQSLDPAIYNIKTDKQKVKDVMDSSNLQSVDELLRKAFAFRSHASLLGRVTNFLEKQAYRENKVFSKTLDELCGLHDLLVDSLKQGYTFTSDDFDSYIKNSLLITNSPKVPKYKIAMDECANMKEASEVEMNRASTYRYDPNRVLDYLYFGILRKHNTITIKQLKDLFSKAIPSDEMLLYPRQHLKDKHDEAINEELRSLEASVASVYRHWSRGFNQNNTAEQNNNLVEECYRQFCAIQPVHPEHPVAKLWLEPYAGPNSFTWDSIRASALYARYPAKAHFAFKMAGSGLLKMKAGRSDRSRHIVPRIHFNMRPKRIKAPVEYEEEEASEDDLVNVTENISA